MRKHIFLLVVFFLVLSCKKDKTVPVSTTNEIPVTTVYIDTCGGHFMGLIGGGRPGLYGMGITKSDNSFYPLHQYFEVYSSGSSPASFSGGALDDKRYYYYVFLSYNTSSPDLLRYNFAEDKTVRFEYKSFSDSISKNSYLRYRGLFCDSRSNKIYCLHNTATIGYTDTFCRITELILDSDTCRERLVFTYNPQATSLDPFIDETTGYIYFMDWPHLKKVDPISGASSIVATYSGVHPAELQFNRNDGMFYGLDIQSTPYSFLKINPTNGVVLRNTPLANIMAGYVHHTFDLCNNRYILFYEYGVYYINCANGKITRTNLDTRFWGLLTYISPPLKIKK